MMPSLGHSSGRVHKGPHRGQASVPDMRGQGPLDRQQCAPMQWGLAYSGRGGPPCTSPMGVLPSSGHANVWPSCHVGHHNASPPGDSSSPLASAGLGSAWADPCQVVLPLCLAAHCVGAALHASFGLLKLHYLIIPLTSPRPSALVPSASPFVR
jgi:hypothetical protein